MDPQIEELKELVRQNITLSQETNKMVHKMRTAGLIGGFFKLLWVGLIIAASLVAYFYFAPYLAQILGLYDSIQEALQQAKTIGTQFGGGQ